MDPHAGDRQARATSFGSAADDYARYRPAPPVEATMWAVGSSPGLVIDLAAGTGNVAQQLLSTAESIVAVDIDPRMLVTLGRRLPGVTRVAARGEKLPFVTAAAGAVVISSAWHWLDPEQAWPEMARVIKPGGTFAVVQSGPDRSVPWVDDVLSARRRRRIGGRSGDRRRVQPPDGMPFSPVEERSFTATVPYEVANLPGLATSYSGAIVLSVEKRHAIMEVVAARAAAHPEISAATKVDLPLRCRVWRTRRT